MDVKKSATRGEPKSAEALYNALVRFQIHRLQRTYKDFTQDRTYAPLVKFFFEDVYNTEDKASRDSSVRKLHSKVSQVLGDEAIENMEKLIRLNNLTDDLDREMVAKFRELGTTEDFTEREYEEAFFLCDNYNDRHEQVELILHSIRYFHRLAQVPGVGLGLKLLRPYAILRGAVPLLNFLQAGFRAFSSVDEIDPFHSTVREREMERLDRIYSIGRRVPSLPELRKRASKMGIRNADRMEFRSLVQAIAQWV